jgi:hypothetical protein
MRNDANSTFNSAFSTQHYLGVAAGAGTIWMIVLNRAGSAPRFGLR